MIFTPRNGEKEKMKEINDFKKKKDYLVCVDSDGCVMNTMDIKHSLCFGPCLIDEWELRSWQEKILNRWNEINLYNITRGINRFKGLSLILSEINEKYKSIDGVETFARWTESAPALSEEALTEVLKEKPGEEIFKKALSWSRMVNKRVDELKETDKLPFPLAKEALQFASQCADVAMVSSANRQAVTEEWRTHGLIDYTDVIMSQSDGSKSHCIAELIKKGYDAKKTIMCGDALGDLKAAKANRIYFYPIIAGHEVQSWQEFIDLGLPKLINNSYKEYEEEKIAKFYNNLNK